MAKWYGVIGFRNTVETVPGIWENQVIDKNYYGDVLSIRNRNQSTSNINSDISISNKISIIADPFANEKFYDIVYVEFMSHKWKVSEVEVNYPRLILSIGGLYNE